MTYVDAAVAPLRKTGQIKIYGPAAFEGMHVGPGVPTDAIDRLVFDYAMDHGALPATSRSRTATSSIST